LENYCLTLNHVLTSKKYFSKVFPVGGIFENKDR
jgi:hypothetical protein